MFLTGLLPAPPPVSKGSFALLKRGVNDDKNLNVCVNKQNAFAISHSRSAKNERADAAILTDRWGE